MDPTIPLLTVGDVATILALSRRTVYKADWQRRAGVPPVRVGRSLRFRLEDVQRLLEAEGRQGSERPHRELDQLRQSATTRVADTAEGRARVDAEIERLREWCRQQGLAWTPPPEP